MNAPRAAAEVPRSDGSVARRRGFALLVVLWVLVGLTATVVVTLDIARSAVRAAGNRSALVRARWAAEECAARLLGAVTGAASDSVSDPAIRALDVRDGRCRATFQPGGRGLDVRHATGEQLRRTLLYVGVPLGSADSLAAAILDWQDSDDVAQPDGAEADWYLAAQRVPPPNRPIVNVRELMSIRGMDALSAESLRDLQGAVSIRPGRLSLLHAAPAALASLPGFSRDAVRALVIMRQELRSHGGGIGGGAVRPSLVALADGLAGEARDSVLRHASEAAQMVMDGSDVWYVVAEGFGDGGGRTRLRSVLELTVEPGASGFVIRGRRITE